MGPTVHLSLAELAERPPWLARLRRAPGGAVAGGGVLVDPRHVITCAHVVTAVLGKSDPAPDDTLRVEFPLVPGAPAFDYRVLQDAWRAPQDDEGDVAVLELVVGTALPDEAVPAPLRSPRRLRDHRCSIHGFPGGAASVIDMSAVLRGASGASGEWVQLESEEVTGRAVEQGASGCPVWDVDAQRVVGIVVAQDRHLETRVAHCIPVRTLVEAWAPLGDLVGWRLDLDPDLLTHWLPRARGVSPRAAQTPGWYFTGCTAALSEIARWAAGEGESLLVVTGGPGAGKSAVVAHALVTADRQLVPQVPEAQRRPGLTAPLGVFDLALHARNRSLAELIALVVAVTEVELDPDDPDAGDSLLARLDDQPRTLVVDALDEAAGDEAPRIARFLGDLAANGKARVLVGTRAGARGSSRAELLDALGPHDPILLDEAPYLDKDDVVEYVRRRLTRSEEPETPSPYREHETRAAKVASAVAGRALGNFLVAQLTVQALLQRPDMVDTDAPGWELEFPDTVGRAFEEYIERAGTDTARLRSLLVPLAFARGDGLPRALWLSLANRLAHLEEDPPGLLRLSDLGWLVESEGAYLVERQLGASYFRLFHEALDEHLRDWWTARHREADPEGLITQVLLASVPADEDDHLAWSTADPYVRQHAPSHAAAAGQLEDLMTDAGFLVGMLPDAMRPVVRTLRTSRGDEPAAIYERALPHLTDDSGANAAVLEVVSRVQGNRLLTERLSSLTVDRPYRAIPRIRPFDGAPARFNGHTADVWGVTTLTWPGLDHLVVVTASLDKTSRVWDPQRPEDELARFDGHSDGVADVTTLDWPGLDHLVVVTASVDKTARVWDPQRPEDELARFDGHTGALEAVTTVSWPGLDHLVVVTAAFDGTARVWDPRHPENELARFDHTTYVWGVTTLTWPGLDHLVVVTASSDRTARVWDPQHPKDELARFDGHTGVVRDVTTLTWPGLDHLVVVTASGDGTARVWDPQRPEHELARFNGHTSAVAGVSTLDWAGLDHTVVVTASLDRTARVWDPKHPEDELATLPLLGLGLAVVRVGSQQMVIATNRGFLFYDL